jgi:hypothetical protein
VERQEIQRLLDMFLENIDEEIQKTTESIARLEGVLSATQIEKGRLETLKNELRKEAD